MRDILRVMHVSAYLIGRSGRWADVSFREWGRLGPIMRKQYTFLRAWVDELVATPYAEWSEAKIRARMKLYMAAARQSFERGIQNEAGVGIDLPAYPGDGTTMCRANCRCRWVYRVLSKSRGDYDISWRMTTAEHCRTCRLRSRKWKRLRIRGGRLVSGYEPIVD